MNILSFPTGYRFSLLVAACMTLFMTGCSSPPVKPGSIKYFALERPDGVIRTAPSNPKKPPSRYKKNVSGWTVMGNTPPAMDEYYSLFKTSPQGIASNVEIIVRMPHCWLLFACEAVDSIYQPKHKKAKRKSRSTKPIAKD